MAETRREYEQRYGVRFVDQLGDGKDGYVLKTSEGQAVKFFFDSAVYFREVRAYEILATLNIDQINGFQAPRLIRRDDELRAIEMTIVQPPFILDFASAYTQQEYAHLGFTQEVLDEREGHWSEVFAANWPAAAALRDEFTRLSGLVLLDLSLNNIRFT
jgi:hypothetical protein